MDGYNYFIGLDWAQANMAVAILSNAHDKPRIFDMPSNIRKLKDMLKALKGKKLMTLEETTTAQWLYTELKPCVDKLVVCDPRRNSLLKEGSKTDKIDALKLAILLKNNLLREVYHSNDFFVDLRKLVSAYEDLVNYGVRFKNQRSALCRSCGQDKGFSEFDGKIEKFIISIIDQNIANYVDQKQEYEKYFGSLFKKYSLLRMLKTVPGIGGIGAIKILSTVVTANRFADARHFLSYCGLVKLERISGGRNYGKKNSHYSSRLKAVFKIAALAVLAGGTNTVFYPYIKYLKNYKRYADHIVRHALARRIAVIVYGVLKSKKNFNKELVLKVNTDEHKNLGTE